MKNANLSLFAATISHTYEFSMELCPWDSAEWRASLPVEKLPVGFERFNPKRQQEFLAGRFCAERALNLMATHRQILIKDKILTLGPGRAPLWPKEAVGAISHSDHLVGALVAPAALMLGVGLDVEALMTDDRAERLARRVCTDSEWQYCKGRVSRGYPLGFWLTLLFSAKESLYKAIFPIQQSFVGFKEVDIVAVDLDAKRFHYVFSTKLKTPLPQQGSGVFQRVVREGSGEASQSVATACAIPRLG